MNIILETAAGFAIFKINKVSKLSDVEYIQNCVESEESMKKLVKLSHFEKFKDNEQALKYNKRMNDGRISKKLKKVISKSEDIKNSKLMVSDPKVGAVLKEHFNIECVTSPVVLDIMRGIRQNLTELVPQINEDVLKQSSVALGFGYSRHKVKFDPGRADMMIIQGVNLLDDLDKEINNYVMRCREWYGLHFPELSRLVSDNATYLKVISLIKFKHTAQEADLTGIVSESLAADIKSAATTSMGTQITDQDLSKILRLCNQILSMITYRGELLGYITKRMQLVAPNLSLIVGELVGARLMAHAGSIYNLSKHASSTIQVLGAEKALFNALKTKKNTPKYGLIYHSELVSSANLAFKGKMSRSVAAKAALATRCDVLSENTIETDLSIISLNKLHARLRILEQTSTNRIQKPKHSFSQPNQPQSKYKKSLDFSFSGTKRTKSEQESEQSIIDSNSKKKKTQ